MRVSRMLSGLVGAVVLLCTCETFPTLPPLAGSVTPVTASNQSSTVGTVLTETINVTDASGHPLAAFAVSFSPQGGGSVDHSQTTTDGSGNASVKWTLGTAAVPQTLVATAGSKSTTFTATAVAAAASKLVKKDGDGQQGAPGAPVAILPSVLVTDQYDNPKSGIVVTFAVASGGGSATGLAATTDNAGVARVGSWILGPDIGPNTLTATSPGLNTVTLTATAVATGGTMTVNGGNNQTATVNTPVAIAPSVVIKNGSNPVVGALVTFAVASGGGTLAGPDTVRTNGSGIATAGGWILGTTKGSNTLTATNNGATGSPVTFTATGTAGPATQMALNAGDGQSATVVSAVPIPPSVVVKDAFGNGTSGVSVTFAVASGGGTVIGGTATSDANGIATVGSWILGAAAGTNTLTATSAGLAGSPVTFTATGKPGAGVISAAAGDAQTATVGTALAVQPTALVTDNAKNPIAGVVVTFTVGTGGGVVGGQATSTATTDAAGKAPAGIWTLGTRAGTNTLTASGPGLASYTFTATGTAGPAASMASNAGNGQTAAVGTAVAIPPSVIVKDAFGNPASGVSVTFAVTGGGGSMSPAGGVVTTNASGIASVGWTLGPVVGANTLSATAPGLSGSPVTFTATGITGTGTMSQNSLDPQTATVNTAVGAAPSVIIKDAFNNPVVGASVTFAVVSGGGSITGTATITTNATGVATVGGWTLGTIAGANTLTATSVGATNSPITFTATGTAGAAASLAAVAGNGQTAGVGTPVATPPSVIVKDAFGNPKSGVSVAFAVTSGGGSVQAPATVVTDATGNATVGGWTVGPNPGSNTLTATSAGLTGSPVTFTATAVVNAGTMSKSCGDAQTAPVGTKVSVAPCVIIQDNLHNPIVGTTVTFTVASGGGSISGPAAITTNASGIATVGGWTLGTTAGPNSLTATAAGIIGSPQTFTATGTAGAPPLAMTLNSGNGQSATVGTALPAQVCVLVKDNFGNPVSGVAVAFAVASGGGSVSGAGNASTNASGIACVGWTLGSVAGQNSLSVTSASVPGTTITFTATGTPSAPASISISAGNGQTAVAGSAVATPPSAIVKDASGNPVSGVSVTFAVIGGSGSVTGATQITNASGIATVGSWTLGTVAGPNSMTASSGTLSGSPVAFTATGIAGPAASIAVNAGNGQTAQTNTNVAIAPSVIVKDANGNVVAGVLVTFAVASGGGSVTGSPVTTTLGGIATVGSWTLGASPGSNTLTASSGSLSVTFTATAVIGAPTTIAVNAGNGQTAVAGSAVATPPSVIVKDAGGNPVANVIVNFAVAGGNGSATGVAATTNGAGIAAVGSWTLGTVAGANSLTASSGTLSGSPVTFTATGIAGPAASIAANAGNGQTATVNTNVAIAPSVIVKDANGNVVGGVSVTFAVASGGGSVISGAATTDAGGIVSVTSWKLGATPGSNTLTATSGSLSGSPVTFTATGVVGPPASIAIKAGDGQTATVHTNVPILPSVIVKDSAGNPVSGVTVTWTVTAGGGIAGCPCPTTDASGVAAVGDWNLGAAGTNMLKASVGGLSVTFTATALAGPAEILLKNPGGDFQTATHGTAVATTPSVTVTDHFGNPVGGVSVTFAVASGGGSIGGSATVTTGSDGIARVGSWTLGAAPGTNTLTATSAGLTNSPLTFTATGN